MKEYIKENIIAFGEEIKKDENTPTKHNIFKINESEPLGSDKAEVFHHIVVKLLYMCKISRVDIHIAVYFLCTRVSGSTYEDWES